MSESKTEKAPNKTDSSANNLSVKEILNFNTLDKVKRFEALAETGGIRASYYYGEMLLKGVWDEGRISKDQLAGTLLPLPSNPDEIDPYLVLPRDPVRAVGFLRRAAEYPSGDWMYEVRRARGLLNFLQKNNLAGFPEIHDKFSCPPGSNLDAKEKKFLLSNAKNCSQEKGASRFVCARNVRPAIKPKSDLFQRIGRRVRNRCLLQILITFAILYVPFVIVLLIPKTGIDRLIFYQLFAFEFVLFIVPLSFFALIAKMYGVSRWAPLCSCDLIRKAHEAVKQDNPTDFEIRRDPFRSTPFFVRNSIRIKQILFAIYLVLSAGAFASLLIWKDATFNLFKYLNLQMELALMLPLFVGLVSVTIMVWDKKSTKTSSSSNIYGSDSVTAFAFIVLMAFDLVFVAKDRDCSMEHQIIEDKEIIENYKNAVLRGYTV